MNNAKNKYEHEIPEGYEAHIEGNRVVVERKKESEYERVRKAIISLIHEMKGNYITFAGVDLYDMIAWLEELDEESDELEFTPVESTLEYKLGFKAGQKENDRYMEGYQKGRKDAEDAYNKSVTFHQDFNERLSRSCYEGGPCTNPHMDCFGCPRKDTTGMSISTSPNTATVQSTSILRWKPSEE